MGHSTGTLSANEIEQASKDAVGPIVFDLINAVTWLLKEQAKGK